MAETAVERRGVSIALACRAFGVSETCYRYSPKLKAENEVIADLLTGLTDGLVTVWCRSFDSVMCSKGDEVWAQSGRMNFARMRCGSR